MTTINIAKVKEAKHALQVAHNKLCHPDQRNDVSIDEAVFRGIQELSAVAGEPNPYRGEEVEDTLAQSRRLSIALRRVYDKVTAGTAEGTVAKPIAAAIHETIDKAFADLGFPTGGLKANTTVRTAGWGEHGRSSSERSL